jgi:hypothetical protein
MGLFWRNTPKPVSREQAAQILRRADVQEPLRDAGFDPAILERQLEYGELRLIDGRTTISMDMAMQVPEAFPPPRADEDDPFESGTL